MNQRVELFLKQLILYQCYLVHVSVTYSNKKLVLQMSKLHLKDIFVVHEVISHYIYSQTAKLAFSQWSKVTVNYNI